MRDFSHIHQGWATVGGKECYFRSRWEHNYALILEYLKTQGNIVDWDHEPDTYKLDVKKGHRSYKPDFKVWPQLGDDTDGENFYYDEIKGYFTTKDKTRIDNFRKQYPQYTVNIIKKSEYTKLFKKYKELGVKMIE